jgi:hypothetical protein
MPNWNDDVHLFMTYWFSGFAEGLASIDETARQTVLHACGAACARSYTAALFQQTWQASTSLEDFLTRLAASFPEAVYEPVEPGLIQVRYSRCACDLVCLGLVTSPLLCECSAQNLKSNFTSALSHPVDVTLQTSILRGSPTCEFLVRLGDRPPAPSANAQGYST